MRHKFQPGRSAGVFAYEIETIPCLVEHLIWAREGPKIDAVAVPGPGFTYGDGSIACPPDSPTQIGILGIHEETLVEQPDLAEHVRSNEHRAPIDVISISQRRKRCEV